MFDCALISCYNININKALLSKNEKIANVSVENHKIILAC